MAIGKQIKHYREKAGWRLKELSARSDVDVGTISALEIRDSSRSEFFQQIAQAFGLTLEQLADETADHDLSHLKTPPVPAGYSGDRDTHPTVKVLAADTPFHGSKSVQVHDEWTMEAIAIMNQLDDGQKQAMVARMREFKQFLGPPRDGQTLSMAA
jgi:transcriptional regulator with XRE-family HTH domain